jgi:hypothetical protein
MGQTNTTFSINAKRLENYQLQRFLEANTFKISKPLKFDEFVSFDEFEVRNENQTARNIKFPIHTVPWVGISKNQIRRVFGTEGVLQIPFKLERGYLICGSKVGIQIENQKTSNYECYELVSKSVGLFKKENPIEQI